MKTAPTSLGRLAVVALIVCLAAPSWTVMAAGNTRLVGKVLQRDDSPAQSAMVFMRRADTKAVYASQPTSGAGEYAVENLPPGYYDIAVRHGEEVFLANRVVLMPASGLAEISFRLDSTRPSDTEWWSRASDRKFDGLEREPDGVARIIERSPRPAGTAPALAPASSTGPAGWWETNQAWLLPVIAVSVAGGVAILLDDDDADVDDDTSSPFE